MAYVAPTVRSAGDAVTAADYNIMANDVIALAAGPVSHTSAAYVWNDWNPTNLTNTPTNAPATALSSYANSTYFTLANAGGTLTITFLVAGYYQISGTMELIAANAFSVFAGTTVFGGTATRYYSASMSCSADTASDYNNSSSAVFSILATANQTLTLLPSFGVTGVGTTANFTAKSSMFADYLGT